MFVKPATSGAVIRDPKTRKQLPDDGGRVSDSNFWRRRVIAGDVVEAEPSAARASATRPAAAKAAKKEETR